ncbi:hypothetical protein DAPPUDRAFT_249156 [Daphnia pulex]|uniref:Uncharacterized protein n=1 Tax=Daphnia pulex TaxID=6669 RepID=E9GW00_DAPPU|nr:hypothetical protein DAPPUDRAFT_249156 [Daphnia pulex]|eukprot:EFX76359.1 hypothetical protein DAPPUDRAFT_249156 [Daphnia pulex]
MKQQPLTTGRDRLSFVSVGGWTGAITAEFDPSPRGSRALDALSAIHASYTCMHVLNLIFRLDFRQLLTSSEQHLPSSCPEVILFTDDLILSPSVSTVAIHIDPVDLLQETCDPSEGGEAGTAAAAAPY